MTVLRLVIDPDRPLYTVQEVAGIYGLKCTMIRVLHGVRDLEATFAADG